ncbi:formylglycine-generating enzyme family protein [Litoreibacter sp.]|nr:formylglycine-generating enzyme family protein [Litoreibacter sp.]
MNAKLNCCAPSRGGATSQTQMSSVASCGKIFCDFDTVLVPGGNALVGTKTAMIRDDGESPLRRKKVSPFHMSTTTVTNAQFRAFVEATGYITEAERIGWSFVFWSDVAQDYGPTEGVVGADWWRKVEKANWRSINGLGTEFGNNADHPVVQVSVQDAVAYANWVGGRLPTEVEWEHAARGGQGDVLFPWGNDEPNDLEFTPCNIWQGDFPNTNTLKDGYARTVPARAFKPNAIGLYQMVGNVWEWTSDQYRVKSLKKHVQARLKHMKGYQLSKGGSFMCHKSYCYRYRIAARSGSSADSAAPHQGFRIVWAI